MDIDNLILASGPVIVENNKVLLNQSSGDDYWKFCGGKPLKNETLHQASKRRVKQEMGIDVEVIKDQPFFYYVQQEKNNKLMDIVLVHWLSKRIGDIKPGPDVEKWKWFEIKKLPENLAPNILPTLKHFKFL